MNVKQIIAQLQKQGHRIKYFQRKDGGVRITSIDGKTFVGSEGNAFARQMVGVELSAKRQAQLQKIETPKGRFGNRKKNPLTKEEKYQIARLQRLWKKKNTRGAKEDGLDSGFPTRRNYRYVKEHYGQEEAQRRLNEAERYALGLAYNERITELVNQLKLFMVGVDQDDQHYIQEVIDLIESKRATFKEDWINPILQENYHLREHYSNDKTAIQVWADHIKNIIK